MNRQSQQLIVAGVVAFLTSGIITLAGLSAAQDMNMGGTPPPGGDMGGMQQQPMMDMGGQQQFQPMNDYRPMDQGTPSTFQGAQEHDIGGVRDFQMDGPNFHPGAPGFREDTGAERGFRGGLEGREGAEREGGRFERKPMEGEMGRFDGQNMRPGAGNERVEGGIRNFAPGKNVEKAGGGLRTFDPRKGNFGGEEMGDASGAGRMEEMGNKASGKKKMREMPESAFGSFGDMSGKDHGAAPMPKMPKIQLPSLGSLEELAEEEEEEVTLPPAVLKSLAKIEAGITKDLNKIAKSWSKLEGKLEDGMSKKEEKSLLAVGTKLEGAEAKVNHVLEQLAPYAEELDSEDNAQFFKIYENLETLSGKIGGMLDDAASYLEE